LGPALTGLVGCGESAGLRNTLAGIVLVYSWKMGRGPFDNLAHLQAQTEQLRLEFITTELETWRVF